MYTPDSRALQSGEHSVYKFKELIESQKNPGNDTFQFPQDCEPWVVDRELTPGSLFEDKYRIVELMGSGGMSCVYKAWHEHMHRHVALKLLHADRSVDGASVRRFQQEALASSRLSHPNIVTAHDFGISNSREAYFVMDCVEGKSLSDIIDDEGPLDPVRVTGLFAQICDALSHAHSKGVIHRDLKPSNLMIVKDTAGQESIRILDFGIAKITEYSGCNQDLTSTGEIFGSPLYMSPEQCMGEPVDHRSDIYSLGVVLYTALTGSPPFHGSTPLATFHMHMFNSPTPFKQAVPDLYVPDFLQYAVNTSMHKKPVDRFQSMDEFKTCLVDPNSVSMPGCFADSTQTASGTVIDLVLSKREEPKDFPWKGLFCVVLLLVAIALCFSLFSLINSNKTVPPPHAVKPGGILKSVVTPAAGLKHLVIPATVVAVEPEQSSIQPTVRAVVEDTEAGKRIALVVPVVSFDERYLANEGLSIGNRWFVEYDTDQFDRPSNVRYTMSNPADDQSASTQAFHFISNHFQLVRSGDLTAAYNDFAQEWKTGEPYSLFVKRQVNRAKINSVQLPVWAARVVKGRGQEVDIAIDMSCVIANYRQYILYKCRYQDDSWKIVSGKRISRAEWKALHDDVGRLLTVEN